MKRRGWQAVDAWNLDFFLPSVAMSGPICVTDWVLSKFESIIFNEAHASFFVCCSDV